MRSCDSWDCSSWSDLWNFSIEPFVDIVFINDSSNQASNNTLDFGNVRIGNSYSTLSSQFNPFRIRNNGNTVVDLVNMTSSESLWSSSGCGLGTDYMLFKVDNASSEQNSFNWSSSITSWTNFSSYNEYVVNDLNYSESNDEFLIHFNITVPSSEPPGVKKSTIILSWEESS